MSKATPKSNRRQQGIAMMLCLFALLLLTSIAMGLMFMANTETSVNANYRSSTQAYYAAKAGVEEARERMRGSSNWIPAPSGLASASNPDGIRYMVHTTDPLNDPVEPWNSANRYFDDELCSEPLYDDASNLLLPTIYFTPCTAGAPTGSFSIHTSTDTAALGYKWVRITPKQNCTTNFGVDGTSGSACTSGANRAALVCAGLDPLTSLIRERLVPVGSTCEAAGLTQVFVITSMAASRQGAKRIVQAEVAALRQDGLGTSLSQIPSALTLLGMPTTTTIQVAGVPTTVAPDIGFPISDTIRFNGNDHAAGVIGCSPTAAKPGIGTSTDALDAIRNTLAHPPTYPANYLGQNYAPGSAPSIAGLVLPPGLSSVGSLQNLVSKITDMADQRFGSSADLALGTDDNPLITVVNGDYIMDSRHGAGVLLVTGTLTARGNPDFNGLILVIGKGEVNLNEQIVSNTGSLNGGMLVAKVLDNSTPPNLLSALGAPKFHWIAGGTFDVNYDSCWINRMASRFGYTVIAEHEKSY